MIFTAPEDQLPYINDAPGRRAAQDHRDHDRRQEAAGGGNAGGGEQSGRHTSGTIRLKAVFDNKDHALWPGQSVSTRLLVRTLKDATVVPDDAIQHGTDGLYAYIVNQDNKAELRKVKVSQSIDGRSVIETGLSPGEQVITAGQFKVQPGTLVSTAVASSDPAQPKVTSGMSDGHFRTLYPLSDRHLADDGRHSVRRPCRLSAAARRAAAAGRLPDHSGHRDAAGRQPRDDGIVGGAAAGAAVRADSRHRPDDFDQLSRNCGGHHPVRPQPQHRRRRQRRAGRNQRRQRPVAEEPPVAADLPQGQSGGLADPDFVSDVGHRCR